MTTHIVVLENYGVSKFQTGQIEIIELGGIVRAILWKEGVRHLDPTPSQLKKFVVGSGGAKKSEMMMWVQKRWGFTAKSDNVADAFGLACMGLAYKGALKNLILAQHEVIGLQKLS
jgi:Holliday junction resolvasome RuvABC endonuclease subunit